MNRNGRGIIQPNAMNIETTYAEGPLAQPLCVTLQTPGAMKILALSGLTKVEALAGQIAGNLPGLRVGQTNEGLARDAVDLAEATLAECARRARPKKEIAS